MSIARTTAARWRGGFLGACSAALAIAAHGYAGAAMPGGGAVVLLVLGAVLIGFAAGARTAAAGVPIVALYLVAGQALGHLSLTFATTHAHAVVPAPRMLAAHGVAALICAVLICVAERLGAAVANRVRALVRTVVCPIPAPGTTAGVVLFGAALIRQPVHLASRGNRAPPVFAAA